MAERCEQCDFDGTRYDDAALLGAIDDLGPRWRTLLAGAGDRLRTRPAPAVWSAVEYAAHSRDITALHVFGVEQALTGDEPVLPDIDSGLVDAVADHYRDEDAAAVLDALEREAHRLASLARDAGTDTWSRGITIGEHRSNVRDLLEHALHDSVHHLDDVARGLDSLTRQS